MIVENKWGVNFAASKVIGGVCRIDVEEVRCAINTMKNGKESEPSEVV